MSPYNVHDDLSATSATGRVGTQPWPAPMRPEAFHGPLGSLVKKIEPETEADPHALLLSVLSAFGNAIGRGPGLRIEGALHATNMFVVVAGTTAKGRKTTSWGRIEQAFRLIDPEWCSPAHVVDGMSTGEGLIWAVRDPILKRRRATDKERKDPMLSNKIDDEGFIDEMEDHGIDDKRLLVQEGEFARVLEVMLREGNTLSAVLRRLWETGTTRTLTRNSPARTTDALVSIVAHAPVDELRAKLTSASRANGFANRFLYCVARRTRSLAFGGNLTDAQLQPVTTPIAEAIVASRNVRDLQWGTATELWRSVYDELSEGRPDMFGAIVARAEAHCVKLATLYALADESSQLDLEHMEAALAVWDYCERSAAFIFGGMLGNPHADRILAALRGADEHGLSRTEIRNLFDRHASAQIVEAALALLRRRLLAEPRSVETGGRPAERWYLRSTGARPEPENCDQSPEG
jgi:hypothetical protein